MKESELPSDSKSPSIFSIVMPMYNAERTLKASVASVQTQRDPDWQLLIVDDCSKDGSLLLARKLAQSDSRIVVISQAVNGGVAAARNAGLKAARGRFICFLDSDDFWLPNKLSEQRKLLEAGHLVVFGAYHRYLADGRFTLVKSALKVGLRSFDFGNPIGNLTGVYDREKLGLELQKKCGHEDYIMWRELVRRAGHAVAVDAPVAIYTVSAGSLSSGKKRAASWQWDILRTHFSFSLPHATFAFGCYAVTRIFRRISERLTAVQKTELFEVVKGKGSA
jgi:teichuronic acid biosynthesis glycosyltransferase TuaG